VDIVDAQGEPRNLRRLQVLSAAFIASSSKAHHGGAFGDDWVPIM
jgi:hypothetical protein